VNGRCRPALSRLEWLSVISFLVWCVGAGLTHAVGVWAGVGGAAIGLGVAAVLLARPLLVTLLRPTAPLLATGVIVAVVMVAATYGLYPLLRGQSAGFARAVGGLYTIFRAAGPRWALGTVLPLMIVAEELVWRGVVQEALSRRLSPAAAVLLTSAAYAAGHAPVGRPMLVALALACGLYWSLLRAWTGSLVPGLLSHLIWDFLVFIFRPLV
jgi:membrane protease YdiL (CAAX protease family)